MIDYLALREENERRYGTDVGRIGRMLLANRYSERSHFLYEILQNAEDALKRRPRDWRQRTVKFVLTDTELTISHYGEVFSTDDVRGVCGIDESTKDVTAIGRFGIGFKSVNAYTDRPEVHSGSAHFAIERYVHPVEVTAIKCAPGETRIVLPFRPEDDSAFSEIAEAFKRLGARTLLFLRQIDAIEWSAVGIGEGVYLRNERSPLGFGAELVTVLGEDQDISSNSQEDWVVFSDTVSTDSEVEVGHTELAFLVECTGNGRRRIIPASDTELVAYFPTIVPTNVGFLIQGPYRTTPSRDNVVRHDPWNRKLMAITARLLVLALNGLRNLDLLDADALQTLPIEPADFGDDSMFCLLYSAARDALRQHQLLPTYDGRHVTAGCAKLARGQELRTLLDATRLSELFGTDENIHWLAEEITLDRAPDLHNYLNRELGVQEIAPENVVRLLDVTFLKKQTDRWIEELYVFLSGQRGLWPRVWFSKLSLLRLEDGSHVPVKDTGGNTVAFLPGTTSTGFPTVRKAVCGNADARAFLEQIGLSEPDLVDDVIINVLPRYTAHVGCPLDEYETDVKRLLAAFETDSAERRKRLLGALSKTPFVAAYDAASKAIVFVRPQQVYIASLRLNELFDGVKGVFLVADLPVLRTEQCRNLLVAAGAARTLAPQDSPNRFSYDELLEMRTRRGCEQNTGESKVEDRTLRGLDELLDLFPCLDTSVVRRKASLLWDALCDLEARSGSSVFRGTYGWFYFHRRDCKFDAAFVEKLRVSKWIVGQNDGLCSPAEITFEELDWEDNGALRERLRFKPPHLDQLALDAGIEPQVLSLLKKHGLTTTAQLLTLLGEHSDEKTPDDSTCNDEVSAGHSTDESRSHTGSAAQPSTRVNSGTNGKSPGNPVQSTPFTYVQVKPDNNATNSDNETHAKLMEIENRAIEIIRAEEPILERAPVNNPGFDLVEKDAAERELRWIEVKAVSGAFDGRWVGLSRVQFETALHRGEGFWLYVVEHVAAPDLTRVIRIQDPAGLAKTFVFDHGWQAFATEVR